MTESEDTKTKRPRSRFNSRSVRAKRSVPAVLVRRKASRLAALVAPAA